MGLESVYGDNYIRREWWTTPTRPIISSYVRRRKSVYQWIIRIQQIYFDDNFGEPDNILSAGTCGGRCRRIVFNLFDCSISRHTEPMGNIATEYVHSRCGLATVGSTKTGGIFNPDVARGVLLAMARARRCACGSTTPGQT